MTSISFPTTTNLTYCVKGKRGEPHLVLVSANLQSLSTMSSAFQCDLRRNDGLVIHFMQVCSTLLFEDSFATFKGTP